MITLLCENQIPWLKHLLPFPEVQVLSFWDDASLREQLPLADALLIRTVTRIDRLSFPAFPERLKAVATATAGFDHVDADWLGHNGIRFFHTPGCNARSVAEYVATAVVSRFGTASGALAGLKAGIIGYGETGSQSAAILQQLGMACICYDPPKSAREPAFASAAFEELRDADFITLHVPLTPDGPHPTRYLAGPGLFLNRTKPLRLLINAARGGVLDEAAALSALKSGQLESLVLDVWENEPALSPQSLEAAALATPHIAGYSQQAKYNASRIICEALSGFLGFQFNSSPPAFDIPEPVRAEAGLADALRRLHPAFRLDQSLRANPSSFSTLRNEAADRCGFAYITLIGLPEHEHQTAKALGFTLLP